MSVKLKFGDIVLTEDFRGSTREGKVTGITLGLSSSDPAGESGPDVEEFEVREDVFSWGSITYGNDYWAYFDQIMKVSTGEEAEKKKKEHEELYGY